MVAGALSAAVGSALAAFGAVYIRSYGWGLFVCAPFVMGLTASVWVDHRGRWGFRTHLAAALFGLMLAALLLLAFAIEGGLCLLMAAPLAIGLAVLGTLVGRQVMGQKLAPGALPAIGVVAAGLPLMMTIEGATVSAAPVFALASDVVIAAPPAAVWREVIEFRPIPEPREFIFTHGIAFPLRAEISGRGAGAIRRCIFNTGTFVEPIEVWEENRRLKFSVSENPPPMIEWSPFQIAPSHLSGFLVSSGGEFALEALPGGGTRLTGTTWYRHSLWPSAYWRLWSDAIIHRIHLRVLDHIKRHAEADPRRPA
jgi:hypothetical protein